MKTVEEAKSNMNKPTLIERFADNGEHSHYELIETETGELLWSEDSEDEINQVKILNIPDVGGSVFLTTEEVKDLKRIRNYFGEHDKTLFEHWAYSYLDNVLKRIHTDR